MLSSPLGIAKLKEVYKIDPATGNFLGLEDITPKMAPTIPKCPHCQRPIRQYVTQRYNRLINRAVIDEMSKRFIITGQTELQEIQMKLTKMEAELEDTRLGVTNARIVPLLTDWHDRAIKDITKRLQHRYKSSADLRSAIMQLQQRASERHQPAHKLHEATLHALQRDSSLETALAALKLKRLPLTPERDHRITLGAKMMEIKVDCITMEDKLLVLSAAKAEHENTAASLTFPGGAPSTLIRPFLKSCADFITNCNDTALPKLAVEASLYYARIARLFRISGLSDTENREKATKYRDEAKALLKRAEKLCEQGFRDADSLLLAVNESLKLLGKEWYEEVTAEELEVIKKAMVSGPKGIATHSGHWYNCSNGHPVSLARGLRITVY